MKKSIILLVIGIALIVIGVSMRGMYVQTRTEGNKTETTMLGGAVGGAIGLGTGAAIGGVGVALCGTGIGIPAGVVCLTLAGVFGAAGGAIGYGCGTPDTITTQLMYPSSLSWIIIAFGVSLALMGIHTLLRNE